MTLLIPCSGRNRKWGPQTASTTPKALETVNIPSAMHEPQIVDGNLERENFSELEIQMGTNAAGDQYLEMSAS
jgi:hypothetical protein